MVILLGLMVYFMYQTHKEIQEVDNIKKFVKIFVERVIGS